MSLKISGGAKENGTVVGNVFDKYGSRNPVVKWIMNGFESDLSELVEKAAANSIHEVGCGEGYWVLNWNELGLNARGSDFSQKVIKIAQVNAIANGLPPSIFRTISVYDVCAEQDAADLIVCCEVLEHLEDPEEALRTLQKITVQHLIVSVPREPLWRMLNMARGKYLADLGNTPGHLQHWSKKTFINTLSKYFTVEEVRSPLPWTMLLCRPL